MKNIFKLILIIGFTNTLFAQNIVWTISQEKYNGYLRVAISALQSAPTTMLGNTNLVIKFNPKAVDGQKASIVKRSKWDETISASQYNPIVLETGADFIKTIISTKTATNGVGFTPSVPDTLVAFTIPYLECGNTGMVWASSSDVLTNQLTDWDATDILSKSTFKNPLSLLITPTVNLTNINRISGPDSTCFNGNAKLEAPTLTGNLAYKWNTDETSTAITVNKSSVYSLQITDLNSGCKKVLQKPFKVLLQPTICFNATNTLTGANLYTPFYETTTFAGSGNASPFINGGSKNATFSGLWDTYIADNKLFVSEEDNFNDIRLVNLKDSSVTSFAGIAATPGGFVDNVTKSLAKFAHPYGIVKDSKGNYYVADRNNHVIRMINSAGIVSTWAGKKGVNGYQDGQGSEAIFNSPFDLAIDGLDNIFVADYDNFCIRKIDNKGNVTTYAGTPGKQTPITNGIASKAIFNWISGIDIDDAGTIYVADWSNTIRKITVQGMVSTIAGTPFVSGFKDGNGANAQFAKPFNVTVDKNTGFVFVADIDNHAIRQIDLNNNVTTIGGSYPTNGIPVAGYKDGVGTATQFNSPRGAAIAENKNLYIPDWKNRRIRRMRLNKSIVICPSDTDNVSISASCTTNSSNQFEWTYARTKTATKWALVSSQVNCSVKKVGFYVCKLTQNSLISGVNCTTIIYDTLQVRFYTQKVLNLTTDKKFPFCPQDIITISANLGFKDYKWSKNQPIRLGGLPYSAEIGKPNNIKVSATLSTNPVYYYVLATDTGKGNCIQETSTPIASLSVSSVEIGTNKETCLGTSMAFVATVKIGSIQPLITWKTIPTSSTILTSTDRIANDKATVSTANTVNVICEAKTLGCFYRDTAQLSINPLPVSFAGPDTNICYNGNAFLIGRISQITTSPYSYTWTPISGSTISDTKKELIVPNVTAQLVYRLTVKDGKNCSNSDDVKVNVNPALTVSYTSPEKVCPQMPFLVTASVTGGLKFSNQTYKFKWSGFPKPSISQPDSLSNVNMGILESTDLKVLVTDSIGCKAESEVQTINTLSLKVAPLLVSPDTSVCIGDRVLLEARVTDGVEPFTMSWESALPITPKTGNKTRLVVSAIGREKIKFKIKDGINCTVVDSIYLKINPLPTITTIGSNDVCANDSLKLVAVAKDGQKPYQYIWSQANEELSSLINKKDTAIIIPTLKTTFAQSNIYSISVIDSLGCKKTFGKYVLFKPLPTVKINDTTGCEGSLLKLDAKNPDKNVKWFRIENKQKILAGTQNELILNKSNAQYSLEVIDPQFNCLMSDTFNVRFILPVSKLFISKGKIACKNEKSFTLIDTMSVTPPIKYSWTLINGLGKLSKNGNFTSSINRDTNTYFPNPELESDSVVIKLKASNFCNTDSTLAVLNFLTTPIAKISEAQPEEPFIGQLINFSQNSLFYDSLFWNFNDGTTLFSREPSIPYQYKTPQKYKVVLTAKNKNGCMDKDSIMIDFIKSQTVYVPNVFSPSANDSDNRTLKVFGTNITNTNFYFAIYNHLGDLVYQTTDFHAANKIGWDGSKQGSTPQPTGVYTYMLKGQYFNGEEFEKQGSCSMLR